MIAMVINAQLCPPFYNKNNKIEVKLNNIVLAELIKKQAQEKVAHKIDAYLIKNNITAIKFCIAQTLISEDIVIQTTNKKKAEKLRRKDS